MITPYKKTIVIMGAGIGGLTVAHILAKTQMFDIHIIERHDIVGGQARSARNCMGMPGEYCWRAYGPGYFNLRSILKEIKVSDTTSVHDLLTDLNNFIYTREDGTKTTIKTNDHTLKKLASLRKLISRVSWMDLYRIFKVSFMASISCQERKLDQDHTTWRSLMEPNSNEAKKFFVNPIGILLGLDIEKVSAAAILDTLPDITNFVAANGYSFSVMTGPTNEMWLDRWVEELLALNVNFHMNNTVDFLEKFNTTLTTVFTDCNAIEADYFINALSVEEAARVLNSPRLSHLSVLSRQIQTSIAIYLDDIILFSEPSTIYLVDSPWVLMILPQGHLWTNAVIGKDRDYWAIGIGHVERKGMNGKTFLECTREEAVIEVWRQCVWSNALKCGMQTKSGKPLSEVKVVDSWVWPSFDRNPKTRLMDTYEPKFSNNIFTLGFRPVTQSDQFTNLFHATAYTQNNCHIFNMEGACESGMRAANEILKRENLSTHNIIERKREILPWIFGPIRALDSIFFRYNLPHPAPIFCFIGMALLLLKLH